MSEIIRDYEVSVWTLQDSYITTLKWSKASHKGQIQNSNMKISDDGTEEFSFSIPMYLFIKDGDVMIRRENPIWSEKDKIFIKNMRKIKVIFNKTFGTQQEKDAARERVFEFLITKVEDTHEEDNPTCEVTCEGLAFHELGKQGYKTELSSDLFYERSTQYAKREVWYDNFWGEHTEMPEANIEYWMRDLGIHKQAENYSPRAGEWVYRVEMNYEAYDSSRHLSGKNYSDMIYEEAYTQAWDDNLIPTRIAPAQEKQRLVDAQESNFYNMTQTIAETFEIFCKYVYSYDENYHIIGRTIVFYNNFVKDNIGEQFEDLTYPHSAASISRELDSTDITTKMYVRPIEDDSSATGQISIIDTSANPTGEDYIMNFDYLHEIKTISDEQYEEIKPFMEKMRWYNYGNEEELKAALERGQLLEQKVRTKPNSEEEETYITDSNNIENKFNGMIAIKDGLEYVYNSEKEAWEERIDGESIRGIITLQEQLIAKESEKIDVDAKLTVAINSVTNAIKRRDDARAHIGSGEATNEFEHDNKAPKVWVVISDSERASDPANRHYYYQVSFNSGDDNGILYDTIKIYKTWESSKWYFNQMLPLNLPEGSTKYDAGKDWSQATAAEKKAVEDYAKYYKAANNADYTNGDKTGEEAVQKLFNSWLQEFDTYNQNNTGMPKYIDKVIAGHDASDANDKNYYILNYTKNKPAFKLKNAANNDYSIFTDSIAWIAYMNGSATIKEVTAKNKKKKEVFKEVVLKSITVGGTSYSLKFNNNGRITMDSWNDMVAARQGWCISYQYGVGPSSVKVINHYLQIKPKWIKKNFAYRTGEKTYKLINGNKEESNLTLGENEHVPSGYLLITVTDQGQTQWSYNNRTDVTIKSLWEDKFKRNNVYPNYTCFDQFVGEEFGADWGSNTIKKFSPVYDSNMNLCGLKNIYSRTPLSTVYATYTFDPTTYYKDITDMWTRKLNSAQLEKEEYTKQQEQLETVINQLELQIRTRLQEKFDEIRKFDQMMGPALRESYWQPENYENYGDLYAQPVNTITEIENESGYINFTSDAVAPETNKNDIQASFYWDTKLFTNEQKDYYEFGVEQEKIHYPCINLIELFANAPSGAMTLANFLAGDLSQLCFTYYNDSFDKEVYQDNEWKLLNPLYKGSTSWYYKELIKYYDEEGKESANAGTYEDQILVSRVEADKQHLMNDETSMQLIFVKKVNKNNDSEFEIIPALMLIGLDEVPDSTLHFITCQTSENVNNASENAQIRPGAQPRLCFYDGITESNGITIQPEHWIPWKIRSTITNEEITPGTHQQNSQLENSYNYEIIYPRIQINSLQLKTAELILTCNNVLLEQFAQYYAFTRDTNYLITLKPEVLFANYKTATDNKSVNIVGANIDSSSYKNPQLYITFVVSNGGTYVYNDALEVLKENSIPKVSYTVSPNILKKTFINELYNKLGQIVMINDYELKFENVFGYISSLELNLDHPWEDSIEVKNYKNKFEDLFSSIAAQTEEMKKNSGILQALSAGTLTANIASAVSDIVDDTINDPGNTVNNVINIVQAYLDANFDGPEVVQAELNKIIQEVDEVLNLGEEGLIELSNLNNNNASILGSFVQDIAALVTPTIRNISTIDEAEKYKPGDIFITSDGKQYISSSYTTLMPFYDGSTSKIIGANLNVDADTGIIDIEGGSEINIKSGNVVTISADSTVNIIGNKEVNLGGCTINIGSAILSTDTTTSDSSDPFNSEDADEEVIVVGEELTPGGINIITSFINPLDPNDNAISSGVFIHPDSIKMQSSDIIMKGSKRIMMATSDGSNVSGFQIDLTNGIWMGSNNGINIYSGNTPFTVSVDSGTGGDNQEILTVNSNTGTSVSIDKDRILMGSSTTTDGMVVKITPSKMIIGAGSFANPSSGDPDITADNGDTRIGAIFSSSKIALATGSAQNRNLILMDSNGIQLGTATDTNAGSFVTLKKNEIKLGSMANLYINTNNLKLQTKASATDGTDTYFAIGTNLSGISASTTPSSIAANSNISVGLFVGKNGTYVKGTIYADSGSFSGTITSTSGTIGGWTISNSELYTDVKIYDSETSILHSTYTIGMSTVNTDPSYKFYIFQQGSSLDILDWEDDIDVWSESAILHNKQGYYTFGINSYGEVYCRTITTGTIRSVQARCDIFMNSTTDQMLGIGWSGYVITDHLWADVEVQTSLLSASTEITTPLLSANTISTNIINNWGLETATSSIGKDAFKSKFNNNTGGNKLYIGLYSSSNYIYIGNGQGFLFIPVGTAASTTNGTLTIIRRNSSGVWQQVDFSGAWATW